MELVEALIAAARASSWFFLLYLEYSTVAQAALLIRQVLPDTIQIWGGPEAGSNAALSAGEWC